MSTLRVGLIICSVQPSLFFFFFFFFFFLKPDCLFRLTETDFPLFSVETSSFSFLARQTIQPSPTRQASHLSLPTQVVRVCLGWLLLPLYPFSLNSLRYIKLCSHSQLWNTVSIKGRVFFFFFADGFFLSILFAPDIFEVQFVQFSRCRQSSWFIQHCRAIEPWQHTLIWSRFLLPV